MYAFSTGSLAITYEGIQEYCKRSRYRKTIDFDKLLGELKPIENTKTFEQQEFKETESTDTLSKVFEGHPVEIIEINNDILFELYSIGMALGYTTESNGKIYPHKVRINSTLRNADIKPFVQGVQTYLNENQLYDFMLEAKTDKCKTFRKWITNEVLPTIRKTGGYVNNTEQFTEK